MFFFFFGGQEVQHLGFFPVCTQYFLKVLAVLHPAFSKCSRGLKRLGVDVGLPRDDFIAPRILESPEGLRALETAARTARYGSAGRIVDGSDVSPRLAEMHILVCYVPSKSCFALSRGSEGSPV